MIPELFRIPLFGFTSLPVYTFGFFMLCCFLGALKLLEKIFRELNIDLKLAENMVTGGALGGILGARVLSVLSYPEALLRDPIGTIFSGAGFVYYGGFIGGVLAVWWVISRRGYAFMQMSDLVAAPLAFGYAIGRVGCQLSGDGDYGIPTSLPWGMNYAYGVIPTMEVVHPTPVYETAGALLLTAFLISTFARSKLCYEGQIFGVYLMLSALFRFLVEFLRIEPLLISFLTQAQFFSIILFLTGLFFVFRPHILSTAESKKQSLFITQGNVNCKGVC
ncbi:MAG TPA: prolipoprotein diacylglyceryl transferase [Oligoflexia bacterium]|nr:prolipoprotein diacylglyceryl transferase [Oligoflexia bacterium]HMP47654.1 prolipoprotein diacylglyceryl transferase [Oligoflexia bacterium]